MLYVNGDPRLAQAINGTRARLAASNSVESSRVAEVSRWLARAYTSLSPSFTVSNLLRDYTMATALGTIKEGAGYGRRFQGNMVLLGCRDWQSDSEALWEVPKEQPPDLRLCA